MNHLSKEQRQRVSGLLLLIPLYDGRVENAKPNGMNYKNWVTKRDAHRKEFYLLVGEEFDKDKLEDYQLRLLRRDRQ